jgi:tRNA (adenine37-N6)-methyltransferase
LAHMSPDLTSQDFKTLALHPIGIVRTSFLAKDEAPRQAVVGDAEAVIELFPDRNLEHAIEDLAGWERIWVIYWFHRNPGWRPKVLPPRSTSGRKGVLATRSPHRPNPLGLSALRLLRVDGLRLHVLGADMIDGTPVLDIKPYVPYSDAFMESGSGWLETKDPLPGYAVEFVEPAESQLRWIQDRGGVDLRARAKEVLQLGPQPHPYRRIRADQHGGVLAVKDWRLHFTVADRAIHVDGVASGYRDLQKAPQLHREFAALNKQATRTGTPVPST